MPTISNRTNTIDTTIDTTTYTIGYHDNVTVQDRSYHPVYSTNYSMNYFDADIDYLTLYLNDKFSDKNFDEIASLKKHVEDYLSHCFDKALEIE